MPRHVVRHVGGKFITINYLTTRYQMISAEVNLGPHMQSLPEVSLRTRGRYERERETATEPNTTRVLLSVVNTAGLLFMIYRENRTQTGRKRRCKAIWSVSERQREKKNGRDAKREGRKTGYISYLALTKEQCVMITSEAEYNSSRNGRFRCSHGTRTT